MSDDAESEREAPPVADRQRSQVVLRGTTAHRWVVKYALAVGGS